MVVIDTHLAHGASNGGFAFQDRGGPYGRIKGAKRIVAVDVTGLPVGALVVPASTHENRASERMLEHLTQQGVTSRLELVLVDRGVTAAAARNLSRDHRIEVRRVGWDDKGAGVSPYPARLAVEVAHGRLGRSRRLAKSFENTTASATGWLQVASIATTLRHLSRAHAQTPAVPAATWATSASRPAHLTCRGEPRCYRARPRHHDNHAWCSTACRSCSVRRPSRLGSRLVPDHRRAALGGGR